jgi:hypothetical protein
MNLRYLPLAPCRVDGAASPAPGPPLLRRYTSGVRPQGRELNAGARRAVASPPDGGASEIPLVRETNLCVPGGGGCVVADGAGASRC